MNGNAVWEALTQKARELGADRAAVIDARSVVTDPVFRDMCASNQCGRYGTCYMCPPDVGGIDELIKCLSYYSHVLVYQTVSRLEDSFDIEGMQEARNRHTRLSQALRRRLDERILPDALHLSVGACGICPTCAKMTGEKCRFPDLATASLEAYGINVSALARTAGMNYVNGQNTVTYFGAIFFNQEKLV